MRSHSHFWIPLSGRFWIVILLLTAPFSTRAQEVTAAISSPTTCVGKSIEMTLYVTQTRTAKAPEKLNIPGLQIKFQGHSTRFEMKDYKIFGNIKFTYTVTPEKTGDFSIPPIDVEVGDRVLKSNPLRFAVSATPTDSPDPKSEDNSEVFDEETKAKAESGDADAQFKLAKIYFDGIGVVKDEVKAFKWFKNSADQKNDSAQERTGWCYSNGFGVPKDDDEAVRWFRTAATHGNDLAKFHLGLCYLKGEGVAKDTIEAYALFNIAGMKDENARNQRDSMAKSMTVEQISMAQKRSKELLVEFPASKNR
jgi:hypothetical protein